MTDKNAITGAVVADKPKPKPNYAEQFGNVRVTGDLLSSNDGRSWLTGVPNPAPQHKYVVWLGCQVIRTVHLVEALNDIFDHLAVDQVTLGGPSNCCGIIHDSNGDKAIGDQLTRQTVKKFDAFQPEQLLYWCPSCDNHLRQKGEAFQTPLTETRSSVIGLLEQLLTPERLKNPVPLRVAVHAHRGFPEQEADASSLCKILARIPQLEVLNVDDLHGIGRHCSDSTVKRFGLERYASEMQSFVSRSKAAGAQRLVSLYHSCHRHLLQQQIHNPPEERIPVENYLTLIARSIGLPEREDKYARYTAMRDVDQIMRELADKIARTGVNPELARRAVESQFGPKPELAG